MAAEFKGFMNPPAVIEERVAERALWMAATKEHREERIRNITRRVAQLNKSDPFAVSRVISQLRSNIGVPRDFQKGQ